MDTEFPGVVARPIGEFKSTSDYQYQVTGPQSASCPLMLTSYPLIKQRLPLLLTPDPSSYPLSFILSPWPLLLNP